MSAPSLLRFAVFAGVLGLALGSWAQGQSRSDLTATGLRIYREGLLSSGEAVTALVQGDVPVLGTQVTCGSCHGRSGMGAIESGRIPAAVAGPLLFTPDAQRRRPAYTDSTLARVLREGIDAAGRPLDPLMPRFQLGDRDMAALTAYLRQLSAAPSPGVEADSLRLATLVAGNVPGDVEQAVRDVIDAFVQDRNRVGLQRLRGGHFPGRPKEIFREWSLDVWRLAGPPETWRGQIETLYRENPVFALVGGVATETWQPIHDFCEAEQVPCLLPDADLPPADDGGFYSYYFSRGLRLEAEIVAAALAAEGLQGDVVSVVDGDPRSPSGVAANALAQAVARRGGNMRTVDALHESNEGTAFTVAVGKATAVVLWLKSDGVVRLAAELETESGLPIFLSSTLLDAKWDDLPAGVQSRAQVVHLTALPGEPDPALGRFRTWARARNLQIREERHQALAYFACLTFADITKHMGSAGATEEIDNFMFRDYLMDLLGHASNLGAFLPLYPRAGITPGQKVLSRGGYLIQLSGRAEPIWLVP